MRLVLTFSRRYGTGASVIASMLSQKFNIPVYGKDYICQKIQNPEDIAAQQAVIKELAKNPCIIVGRGASEVLKDQPNVINIFVSANKADRLKRIAEKEGIGLEEAAERMKKVDAERINFYEKNTGKFWGDMDNYDIIIDSSKYGIENCADVICKYLEYHDYI